MARLVPCLAELRSEFDRCFPGRDRASDGWIGDPAHAARASDHNPDGRGVVHAIDVDVDLGSPMADVVRHLVARRDRRLTYIIHARTIWSASHGWQPRPYRGDNPHIEHVHISASDEPHLENDTRSFDLEEVPVALTAADKEWIAAEIDKAAEKAANKVWTQDINADPKVSNLAYTSLWAMAQAVTRIEAKLNQPPA